MPTGPSPPTPDLALDRRRPATRRIPLDGTSAIVSDHVESNRADVLARIEALVGCAIRRSELAAGLDTELTAPAVRSLGEEAGRMLLHDPESYSAERYEQFVSSVVKLVWA